MLTRSKLVHVVFLVCSSVIADDLPIQRTSGGNGASASDDFTGTAATAGSVSATDAESDSGETLAFAATVAIADDPATGDTAAASFTGEGMMTVSYLGISDFPQMNGSALAMASGMGTAWTAATGGSGSSGAGYQVLPDPNNSAVTNGICQATLITLVAPSGAGGGGMSVSEIDDGPIPIVLTTTANGSGFNDTTLTIDGTVVWSASASGARVLVEFPTGVGSNISGNASSLGVASAASGSPASATASANCSAHSDFKVIGIDPSLPASSITRVTRLIYDEENDEWDLGDVLYEYDENNP